MNRDPYDISDPNTDLSRGYLIGEYKPDRSYAYDHESKTFHVSKRGSITFTTKRSKNYQSTLWEILLESWEQNQSKPVRISKQEIISRVAKRLKLSETWDRDKLKRNLRHLVEKIGTYAQIAGLIKLESDETNRDYIIFNISVPTD